MIWNWQSSHTKCIFHSLREAGAELTVSIKHPLTLTRHNKDEAIPNNPKCIHKLAPVNIVINKKPFAIY